MLLTDEQKSEIKHYIITVPKYRETYNELYDHILNSFEDSEAVFSLDEVAGVVNNDFGGFSEIVEQEKIYHKELGKKYNKHFRLQFVDTLKWPGLLVFAFCLLIYFGTQTTPFNIKPMLFGTTICFVTAAILGFSTIIINRIRYSKYSILDNYLGLEYSFGLAVMNVFLQVFISRNLFGLSENSKLIAMLMLYFFCSVYIRTLFKIYKRKFKILAA